MCENNAINGGVLKGSFLACFRVRNDGNHKNIQPARPIVKVGIERLPAILRLPHLGALTTRVSLTSGNYIFEIPRNVLLCHA